MPPSLTVVGLLYTLRSGRPSTLDLFAGSISSSTAVLFYRPLTYSMGPLGFASLREVAESISTSAGVKAGMSSLPGGRYLTLLDCDPIWSSSSDEAS